MHLRQCANLQMSSHFKTFLSLSVFGRFSVEEYHFPLILFLYVTSITWYTFRVPTTQVGENICLTYRGRSQYLEVMNAVNCQQN